MPNPKGINWSTGTLTAIKDRLAICTRKELEEFILAIIREDDLPDLEEFVNKKKNG